RQLDLASAQGALDRNLAIVAQYIHGHLPKSHDRKADHALIMATVLQEVIDAKSGKAPSTYLKSRRRLWHRAKKLDIGGRD
ncbi:MAG: hypothetical protein AAF386_05755, partial [Pseudomonadota bacterium]